MNYQGLRSCAIGKAVNRLTKISAAEAFRDQAAEAKQVESLASDIVAKWRAVAEKEKDHGAAAGPAGQKNKAPASAAAAAPAAKRQKTADGSADAATAKGAAAANAHAPGAKPGAQQPQQKRDGLVMGPNGPRPAPRVGVLNEAEVKALASHTPSGPKPAHDKPQPAAGSAPPPQQPPPQGAAASTLGSQPLSSPTSGLSGTSPFSRSFSRDFTPPPVNLQMARSGTPRLPTCNRSSHAFPLLFTARPHRCSVPARPRPQLIEAHRVAVSLEQEIVQEQARSAAPLLRVLSGAAASDPGATGAPGAADPAASKKGLLKAPGAPRKRASGVCWAPDSSLEQVRVFHKRKAGGGSDDVIVSGPTSSADQSGEADTDIPVANLQAHLKVRRRRTGGGANMAFASAALASEPTLRRECAGLRDTCVSLTHLRRCRAPQDEQAEMKRAAGSHSRRVNGMVRGPFRRNRPRAPHPASSCHWRRPCRFP